METTMKVTTNGQVTIPLEIRERLSIYPGTDVEFAVEGDVVKLVPARPGQVRGKRVVERPRGRATVRMTTDENMALTRGR
jgi:AbrB family looped-hinge helix DNA binding protein